MIYFIEHICNKCGGLIGCGAYKVTKEEFDNIKGHVYKEFIEINDYELSKEYQKLINENEFKVKCKLGTCLSCNSSI